MAAGGIKRSLIGSAEFVKGCAGMTGFDLCGVALALALSHQGRGDRVVESTLA